MQYLKIVLFGPPGSGKSSTLRRLLQEIENLRQCGKESSSTGMADTKEVVIKKLTSTTAALPQWKSVKRSKEGGRLEDGDVDDLTQLFYRLITESQSKPKQSADKEAKLVPEADNPQPPPALPDPEPMKLTSKLRSEVSSVPLSEDEEKEIDRAFKKLTAVVRKDSPEDLKQMLQGLTLANMVNVGGQRAFLDVLPTLTIGPALYMLFFKLNEDFKKSYTVYFRPADDEDKIKLESSYINEEVISQAISSIVFFTHQPPQKSADSASQESADSASQKSTDSASSHAIIVGTFKDKATSTDISKKEKMIEETLMKSKLFKEGLLVKTKELKPFFTVDNMMGTEESEMRDLRASIEAVIKQNFAAHRIPASWLMFRMILHLLGKPIVSLGQCEEIAKRLSMTTPVREAIWFFHHNVGSLMHYPDIPSMKDRVICTPQVVFDSISTLIIDKFLSSKYGDAVVEGFLLKGQFTLSDIKVKIEDQKSDLLTPRQLVDLLKDRNVVAEIKHDKKVSHAQEKVAPPEPKYIMPAVLKHASEEDLKQPTSTTSTIMIHFETGFVPFGVFCASVAKLIALQDSLSPTWELCDDQVMKNKVTFCIDMAFDVTLISRPQYLEIQIEEDASSDYSLSHICSFVRQTVVQTLENVISKMKYRPYAIQMFSSDHLFDLAFTCCRRESHCDHLMKVNDNKEAVCLHDNKRVKLEDKHLIWFSKVRIIFAS